MNRTFPVVCLMAASLWAQDAKERIRWCKDAYKQGAGAVPALLDYIKSDPDDEVRREAVKSLNIIGGEPVLDALIVATQDKDSEVQARATDGIVNVYIPGYVKSGFTASLKRAGTGIKGKFTDTNDQMVDPWVKVKPQAIEALGRLVKQGTWPEVKANAARALGILRGGAAVPQLLDGLRGRDTTLIIECLVALQKIRDRKVAAEITPHINDLNPRVQTTAMELAGLLQDKVSLPPLRRAFESAKLARVKASALMAIAMIPDESNRALLDANLDDKEDDIRAAAAEGYGRLKNKADLPKLEKAFAEETHMKPRLGLAFSLVSLGKIEMTEFSPLQYLVNTLNSSAYSGVAAPFLIELARDKSVREALYPGIASRTAREKVELADVIARTGDQASMPVLEKLAADTDPKVGPAGQRAVALLRTRL